MANKLMTSIKWFHVQPQYSSRRTLSSSTPYTRNPLVQKKAAVWLLQLTTLVLPLQDGRVLDRASERLGIVRRQRRDNMQSLRQCINDWARNLASQNVSEEALVVIRRDRLCVPVKAGRQVSYSAIAPAKHRTRQGSMQYKSGLRHASVLDLRPLIDVLSECICPAEVQFPDWSWNWHEYACAIPYSSLYILTSPKKHLGLLVGSKAPVVVHSQSSHKQSPSFHGLMLVTMAWYVAESATQGQRQSSSQCIRLHSVHGTSACRCSQQR